MVEVRTTLLRLVGAVAVAALTLASCGDGDGGGGGGDGNDAAETEPGANAGAPAGGVDISAFTALGEGLCTLASPEAVADAVDLPVSTPYFTAAEALVCTWNFGELESPPTLALGPDSYSYHAEMAQSPLTPGPPARETEVAGRPAIVSPPDPEAGEFAVSHVYVQLSESPEGATGTMRAFTEDQALALAEVLTPALVDVLG